jgi:hypothetical protein
MLPRNSSFFCSAGLAPTLRVSRGCQIVSATGRPAFLLRGRESLRWILEALVRSRRVRGTVTVDELFDAGWPGTGVGLTPATRAQRVYAAISRLRRMGLQGIITTSDEGYVLDAGWRVEVDSTPQGDAAYI